MDDPEPDFKFQFTAVMSNPTSTASTASSGHSSAMPAVPPSAAPMSATPAATPSAGQFMGTWGPVKQEKNPFASWTGFKQPGAGAIPKTGTALSGKLLSQSAR